MERGTTPVDLPPGAGGSVAKGVGAGFGQLGSYRPSLSLTKCILVPVLQAQVSKWIKIVLSSWQQGSGPHVAAVMIVTVEERSPILAPALQLWTEHPCPLMTSQERVPACRGGKNTVEGRHAPSWLTCPLEQLACT